MNKYRLKRMVAVVLLVVASCAFGTGVENPERHAPNILLILVDDVGYADVGVFSARINHTTPEKLYYETPHIDQLAQQGTMFTQFYPTLMEVAGVNYSDYKADKTTDGESLVPLFGDLENKNQAYTRDAFYQFYGKMGYQGFHQFATWATLRQGDYKLHYDYQGKVELYNISKDMFEKNDLVSTEPKLAHDLLVQLTDWLRANCNEAYLPSPNAQFNPHGELPYGPYVPLEQLKAMLLKKQKPPLNSR